MWFPNTFIGPRKSQDLMHIHDQSLHISLLFSPCQSLPSFFMTIYCRHFTKLKPCHAFCYRFLWFRRMYSSFILSVVCQYFVPLYYWVNIIPLHKYHICYTHSLFDGYLGYLQSVNPRIWTQNRKSWVIRELFIWHFK